MRREREAPWSPPIFPYMGWIILGWVLTWAAVELHMLQRPLDTVSLTGGQWAWVQMPRPPYSRHPLGPAIGLALGMVAALVIGLFVLGAITYAYRRIGIGQGALFVLIWLSLLGGVINIPVAKFRGRVTLGVGEIVAFGVRYRMPLVRRQPATILAVNLGGAVIPTALSLYLLIRNDVWWQAAIAVVFVAALVHAIARPIPGLGIAVPALVPPLLAAAAALILSATAAASIAYISGTLGTLIGADLLNLHRLRNLGAGVASIGGAGTFDGVFLSGIIAVLLVAAG